MPALTLSFNAIKQEQELRREESNEHPKHLEDKATCGAVTFGGNVEVQSAPYAYDHSTEAKRDDPESAPLFWFWHPRVWGVVRSGGIGRRILHLLCGSLQTTGPAK